MLPAVGFVLVCASCGMRPPATSPAQRPGSTALIFGVVQMGIFYTGIDTDWFKLFMGAMMVTAVLFNSFVRNRAMRSR